MIRVLQSVNIMDRAGLETMLMNYYRNIDRSVVQFDFLTHRLEDGAYDDEIRGLGGNVFHAPRLYPQNLPEYYRFMREFFQDHKEYQIIHSHIDAMSYFPLKAAWQNGIPVRIAHSHSSKLDRDLKLPIKFYALKSISKVANYCCACGELAGRFMFPDGGFSVIRNAIDLQRFAFDEQKRRDVRKKLDVDGNFVIGHVGRYSYIKNQLFLIDILREVLKYKKNAILLLVGKGPDEQKILNKAKELGLENEVKLLIDRSDVDQLYQALDVFVMPSLFEGLPMVGVEAQANGLPFFVSDKVSPEVLLTGSAKQVPTSADASEWASMILNSEIKRNDKAKTELTQAGYDIKTEAGKLQEWYVQLSEAFGK